MKIVLFYHSLVSDWNNGNAHFLRGVANELLELEHHVSVYEPANGWSLAHLRAEHGEAPLSAFAYNYPKLSTNFYERPDLRLILRDADLVVVHEWNDPELIAEIGREKQRSGHLVLLFHDTHHRAVTAREQIANIDLRNYDGVLAYGSSLAEVYRKEGWARDVWTWHEAADIRVFHPLNAAKEIDLVWIGNWGDNERSAELTTFLIEPSKTLGLSAVAHGVRYPEFALEALAAAGIEYRGWLPNFEAPRVFARSRLTVHVPRRPYAASLPGIPTIRSFEAMACGIPLVTACWQDSEGLFSPGKDYLVAHDAEEMRSHIRLILENPSFAEQLAAHGLATIRGRHTCAHRAEELIGIATELAA